MTVYDLFAGPGGWDQALRLLGAQDVLGWDSDPAACATAQAAGHARVQDPVEIVETEWLDWAEGHVASPPCQGFTGAGGALAAPDTNMIYQALALVFRVGIKTALKALRHHQTHEGTALVLEPLRWAIELEPTWVAWEQVPEVLPLWEASANLLREMGYTVWTGRVQAEQFGVPQTRTRAVLLAHADFTDIAPEPTHSVYRPWMPHSMDDGVLPWVPMEAALGFKDVLISNYGTGGDPANRGMRHTDQPSYTITGRCNRNKWLSGPALTIKQAGVLQTFPADYPWQGNSNDKAQQVGNAVPPVLGAALLKKLL